MKTVYRDSDPVSHSKSCLRYRTKAVSAVRGDDLTNTSGAKWWVLEYETWWCTEHWRIKSHVFQWTWPRLGEFFFKNTFVFLQLFCCRTKFAVNSWMRAMLLRISATFLTPFVLYFKTFTFSCMLKGMCVLTSVFSCSRWSVNWAELSLCFNRYFGGGFASKHVCSLTHEAVMLELLSSIGTHKVSVLNFIISCPCVTLCRQSCTEGDLKMVHYRVE